MSLRELSQAGRAPVLPLTLEVVGEALVLERLLRVLPGQRQPNDPRPLLWLPGADGNGRIRGVSGARHGRLR